MPHFNLIPPWLSRLTELRIDVSHDPKRLDGEIGAIHDRIRTPGDALHGIPQIGMNDPDLVIRHGEADGEFYVYVEDIRRRQLAGYTVFNRLIEVPRRTDRYVRAPHSKYDPSYQRRGLATAIYRWGLDAGLCLLTGARQSPGAHALWHSLALNYQLGYVDLRDKTLTYLGPEVSAQVLGELPTRMLLLGKGWTLAKFSAATGMR
ncbi:N-acetyltransferase [Variovorax sp. J2P1-59]|uniref:N-acetyltransferase n=1 Tax=Variovorax flavidus TaxID=3053501 RepID=UPI002576824F|nr:N-acetyltransferase [Variovorax sp. J2P1-59]MDM0072877.1 N-acetyltransferase [Variovorax sp. J2P1-59]